jgi:DNA polymerase bacteriophage-type
MSDTAVHADFETRSLIDLKKRGLDVYANHASTEPLCLAFAFDDEAPELRVPAQFSPRSGHVAHLLDHVASGGIFYAHNAQFEYTIWNRVCVPRYGWPPLKLEQMRCTMAMALAMGFPGKLEELMSALRLDERKDMAGHRVMQQVSRPRKKPAEDCPHCRGEGIFFGDVCSCVVWWEDAGKLETLYAYCVQDVVSERAAHRHLRELSDYEQRVWVVDQKINHRGVAFDREAAVAALEVVDDERQRLNERVFDLTGGAVATCTNAKAITAWLNDQGVSTDSVAKAEVIALLEDDDLPANAKAVLQLRQEAGKSSLAKLDKALAVLGAGDRLRFTKQYHSATTGRWGGRGVQLDNLVRPPKWMKAPELQDEVLRNLVKHRAAQYVDMMYGAPMDVLTYCIRAFFIASRGKNLIAPDFSNIEGRVIALLAGEEWKLDAFREADDGLGPEVYVLTYARCFNVPVEQVDDYMRQIGKVCELALGFGGGVGAFQAMARVYNVKIEDAQADVAKNLWREQHPNVVKWWYALEKAAINAVMTGNQFEAGAEGVAIKFRYLDNHLWARLPSGRVLCYPFAEVRTLPAPWGQEKETLTFMAVPGDDPKARSRTVYDASNSNRWMRHKTYGGSLAENFVQAASRDLLADALVRLEDRGFETVMHVHDEAVIEVDADAPDSVQAAIERLMCQLPPWAAGLPLHSKAWRGSRYRKD